MATASVLPVHNLLMDTPRPSEPVTASNGEQAYRWLLTETERAHIADMLDVQESEISLSGNIMVQDREVCSGCGKHSGLDDLVHNAYHLGIHNKDFMLNILTNGPKSESPAHDVHCSRCSNRYETRFRWAGLW
ncbi:hypothetical protein BDW74DRAFT_184286 [Aspergillus multicolor]|uniref:uncharacterized protein n=1 Tax=Aspergillus multicolor TaxID=41759 RepID=UPI003CCCB50A